MGLGMFIHIVFTAMSLVAALFAYGMVFDSIGKARSYNDKGFYIFAVVFFVLGLMLTYLTVVMVRSLL